MSPRGWRDWKIHVRLHFLLLCATFDQYARRDMTSQNDVFNNSLALFASESQDIRAAAAFATGALL